jgi:hypothetical protein
MRTGSTQTKGIASVATIPAATTISKAKSAVVRTTIVPHMRNKRARQIRTADYPIEWRSLTQRSADGLHDQVVSKRVGNGSQAADRPLKDLLPVEHQKQTSPRDGVQVRNGPKTTPMREGCSPFENSSFAFTEIVLDHGPSRAPREGRFAIVTERWARDAVAAGCRSVGKPARTNGSLQT